MFGVGAPLAAWINNTNPGDDIPWLARVMQGHVQLGTGGSGPEGVLNLALRAHDTWTVCAYDRHTLIEAVVVVPGTPGRG